MTTILPDVRKTFDGTTSHSTRLPKEGSQVAGYGRAPVRKTFGMAPVGAGHAREKMFAGTKNICPGTRMARSYNQGCF
jgi:hypothetical protein